MMRRNVLRVSVCGVVLAAVLVVNAPSASACSCVPTSDAEAFARADVVFAGELVEVIPPPPAEIQSSADPEQFVFDIDLAYKGEVRSRETVITPMSGASCGLELSGRGPFLVFASTEPRGMVTEAEEGLLFSDLCSGSRALSDGAVPGAFGAGEPPQLSGSPAADVHDALDEAPTAGPEDEASPVPALVVAGLLLALVGAGVGLLVRRRRCSSGSRRPTPAGT